MANENFTAADDLTPEQLAEQYPDNGDPFGVWYCIDAERYRWVVNNKKGHAFTGALNYKTALILSDALKIRHKKIKNGLILNAEQQSEITSTKKIIEIDTESFNQASILLTRAHGMLDVIFTLDNASGGSTEDLCKGSLSAALDAAMASITQAEELLSSGKSSRMV